MTPLLDDDIKKCDCLFGVLSMVAIHPCFNRSSHPEVHLNIVNFKVYVVDGLQPPVEVSFLVWTVPAKRSQTCKSCNSFWRRSIHALGLCNWHNCVYVGPARPNHSSIRKGAEPMTCWNKTTTVGSYVNLGDPSSVDANLLKIVQWTFYSVWWNRIILPTHACPRFGWTAPLGGFLAFPHSESFSWKKSWSKHTVGKL